MKKFLLGIAVCAAMVVCTFAISWFIQASRIKSDIKTAMSSMHPDMGIVSAENVEIAGFPFEMRVIITNPRTTLHNDVALNAMIRRLNAASGNSAGVLAPPRFPESILDMALDGKLILSINAISNHVTYRSEGTTRLTLTKGNMTLPISIEPEGSSECDVKLNGTLVDVFSQSWDFKKLLDPDQLAAHFKSIDCRLPAMMSTDRNSGQLMFSQAASILQLSHELKGKQREIKAAVNFKDSEIYPAGDAAYNLFAEAYSPIDTLLMKRTPSLYGKQSFVLDIEASLPENETIASSEPFALHLKNMEVTNDYYRIKGMTDIVSNPSGDQQHAIVKFAFTSDFTEKQPIFARQMIDEIIHELGSPESVAARPAIGEILKQYNNQILAETAFTMLPDVSTLGTLTQTIDTEFTGNAATKDGTLKINALELSSRDYGISAKGELAMSGKSPIPAANATLTCKNCGAMVDTLQTYLVRVENALVALDPKFKGGVALSPVQMQSIRQLLAGLGVPNAAGGLEFVIKSEAEGITVNQKTLPEIMMMMAPPK